MGGASAAQLQLLGLLLIFYNQLVGLPAPWVSAALAISILIDAFWDPIVGQMSDGAHTRWGRRHPFIYGAAIPAGICFALLFMPPRGWSNPALFLYLVAMIVGARMFASLCEIPGKALAPELTRNYDERTNIQSYRFLFQTVIGGLVAALLGFGYFLRATKLEPYGQFNRAGYGPYATSIAVISVVAILVSALATQRYIPFLHRPPQRRTQFLAMARAMGTALSNRNFVSLAASSLIFGVAVGISSGLNIYFETYVFQLGSKALLALRLWVLPAALAGVVLAPWLGRTLDKKRACLLVFFIAIASTVVPLLGWLLGLMPAHAPWVLPILIIDRMAILALATTGFIIVSSMISDVVEASQLKTGRRSEGLLYAAESLVQKLSTSFAALIPGLLLALVAFPAHARPGHVDVEILRRLIVIYLPIYTGLTLCSTSALMFYRITRGEHEDNLRRLADSEALIVGAEASLEAPGGPAAVA